MGKLFIIPTPIGNLEDITIRAIRILKEVDLILAEDTRKTGILLKHFEIENRVYPHHKFNEHKSIDRIIEYLEAGQTLALVSDAGTPAISDPGYLLVKHCTENNIDVECLPGATAFVPALVNSGLPNDRFCFEGFLPPKKGRQKRLAILADESRTLVFYESPYRLIRTLEELKEVLGPERQASISREISKLHEETIRGTIDELVKYYSSHTLKGEIVLIVAGKPKEKTSNKNKEDYKKID